MKFLIEKTLNEVDLFSGSFSNKKAISKKPFDVKFNTESDIENFKNYVNDYIESNPNLENNKKLNILKKREELGLEKDDFVKLISEWFERPTFLLKNYYEASLTNSNPLLHPARLYGMWHDWKGETCNDQTLFYAQWDELSSEVYIAMDEEFQKLCCKVGVKIPSVLDYYESTDAVSLTRKLRSIVAFQTIKAPMKQTENGFVPDFESRYFMEDFPYGLQIIKDLAQAHQLKTPVIDKVLKWGTKCI